MLSGGGMALGRDLSVGFLAKRIWIGCSCLVLYSPVFLSLSLVRAFGVFFFIFFLLSQWWLYQMDGMELPIFSLSMFGIFFGCWCITSNRTSCGQHYGYRYQRF